MKGHCPRRASSLKGSWTYPETLQGPYTTVDDINPGVPVKGPIRLTFKGLFKGSIGFQGLGFRLMI